ncbi:hypothetical protein AGMMS50256_13040 [Betaproteobacteria bacterium]|nr:hypothetical protein AGMMS50256_13040 [Betaproteobacteria bacterium]
MSIFTSIFGRAMAVRFPEIRFVVAVLFACCVSPAQAEDAFEIRFVPSTSWGASFEIAKVRIERFGTTLDGMKSSVADNFFNEVRRILSENDVVGDWQFVSPEAPYIEMTIEMGGKRVRLVSWHTIFEATGNLVATERGIKSLNGRDRSKVLSQQSERFRKNRRAFEQLLALASEQLRAKFGGT